MQCSGFDYTAVKSEPEFVFDYVWFKILKYFKVELNIPHFKIDFGFKKALRIISKKNFNNKVDVRIYLLLYLTIRVDKMLRVWHKILTTNKHFHK